MKGLESQTETIDSSLLDLDQRSTSAIIGELVASQKRAVLAVEQATSAIDAAVTAAAKRLQATGDLESQMDVGALSGGASGKPSGDSPLGRLILCGAGASGRLAVQDGAEMWPTYGWPHDRLLLSMAGGEPALLQSVEGVEDNEADAIACVEKAGLNASDVVVALAASGRSAWTCAWCKTARQHGALTIGLSNNDNTPLLEEAEYPIYLDSGPEVLAGSTRMAAGTAQKAALNVFSTALMIRLNRTYGNLMVDMAAVNSKLDSRRLRMLQTVVPDLSEEAGNAFLVEAGGWVKLAALLATGNSMDTAKALLEKHQGSLRSALNNSPATSRSSSGGSADA